MSIKDLSSIYELEEKQIREIFERKLALGELVGSIKEGIIELDSSREKLNLSDSEWNLLQKSIKFHEYIKEEKRLKQEEAT